MSDTVSTPLAEKSAVQVFVEKIDERETFHQKAIPKRMSEKRIIFAAAFGNALEFFDFSIYNFFVIYFAVLFFPKTEDPTLGLLLALATFGASFFMRPLGGVLIGAYADRAGRKPAMILTILLMSLGAAMIGFAPTYETAGYWGTLTLVLARLLQGLAAGGEIGASTTMLVESAPANRRGFYSSWQIASQGAAVTFGGLLALGLTAFLPWVTDDPEAMRSWGWRIPFLIGVTLAPIGCWLRMGLENEYEAKSSTEGNKSLKAKKAQATADYKNMRSLLRQHLSVIIVGILLMVATTVNTYISMYFFGTFSVKFLGIEKIYSDCSMLMAGVISLCVSLYVGALSDRIGRKKIIFFSRVAVTVLAYPAFWVLVQYPMPGVLFAVVFVMVVLTAIGVVPSLVVISELFPKRIRALGFSLVYGLGVALFGGFAQYFSVALIQVFDSLTAPALYLGGCTLLSMLALPFFQDQHKEALKL